MPSSAITVIGSTVLVFPELCHACGACSLLCPEGAIREEDRDTGVVEFGSVLLPGRPAFPLVTGVLAVGEAKAVPTTRATMASADDTSVDVVLIDAPPGTSCPVIEAVRGSDLVVLVTEPTPFGLHDLELAVEMVRALGLRCVVAVNRADLGDDRVHRYCAAEGLEIVLELPNDRRIAEAYARGELVLDATTRPGTAAEHRLGLDHRHRAPRRGDLVMSARELVVISGKGGTGKTSVVAAFAALAGGAVLADCDVDAADLHLVLSPELGAENEFSGRRRAIIDPDACTACGRCAEVCRFEAVLGSTVDGFAIDAIACEGCELCRRVCSADAIRMEAVVNGAWMVSETRFGPLVHARLGVAEDNSGKLVTLVRNEARSQAQKRGLPLVIIDGSPGIGCPVIASLAGAHLVLAVTEPTVSGRHDLDRVLQVVRQFRLPFAVCVNKADLNPELSARIADEVTAAGVAFVATIDYDPAVTRAQVAGTDIITSGGRAAAEITTVWDAVSVALSPSPEGEVLDG